MKRNTAVLILLILLFSGIVEARQHESKAVSAPPILSGAKTDQTGELPELKMQAYVGTHQFVPQRDNEWVEQCLNLGLDQKKFGVRIIAYRIQWFSGKWSGWFVPGVNDLYKKSFEPLRRFWACFNDHHFEIIYTADKKMDFSRAAIGNGTP